MKLLVIGGGGREHALAWRLARSPGVEEVLVAPGNAGTAREPGCRNVPGGSPEALAALAAREGVAFTVVGPEAALAAGVVDAFRAHGLAIFGPTRAAARLESSKAFAKAFMQRHGIPTASHAVFEGRAAAHAHLDASPVPVVVKADGLAAGKGVVVAATREEAHAAVDAMLGGPGDRVVIESFLEGEEASFFVVSDGTRALPLATAQDHKRIFDGDRGPNTGGMGAYSPAPVVTPEVHSRVMREIVGPTIAGMAAEGAPFAGFLYVGLMIDASGAPRVVEYNVRLGDPEAQVLMQRFAGDLAALLGAACGPEPRLAEEHVRWDPRPALGVVLAAADYPAEPRAGDAIEGLPDPASEGGEVKVFHAGTRDADGRTVTAGGRVLLVSALGADVAAARGAAYAPIDGIRFEGMQFRRDIGHRALARNPHPGPLPHAGEGVEGQGGAGSADVRAWLLGLQQRIVDAMEAEGGDPFLRDAWTRPVGGPLEGDGVTRLVEGGALLERGGCSFSHVKGQRLPASATQHRGAELADAPFEAMGVSLVFHPRNPYVPTVHMNVRMLVARPAGREPVAWFGGGMDLTPYYGFEEDARHFHRTARDALAPHGAELYPTFKAWCDRYFWLKHRDEPRGVGGVFFDDFAEGGFDAGFAVMRATGDALLAGYLPIVRRRKDTPYGERERDFQAYRRGRYVEFNLVFDRGTLFGLQSGGRTESILMSMPPRVTWRYDWKPEPGTPEARLYTDFLRPRDWAEDPVEGDPA